MTRKKKILTITSVAMLLPLTLVIFANAFIGGYSSFSTNNINEVPQSYAAIMLGTSKKLSDGRDNLYYAYRVNAAVTLYTSGKVKKVVVSGDNGTTEYNEPQDMKLDLIANGIPESDIICDYAGFRTLDSIIRFKNIFGQSSGIVVSQEFHNSRAIYIGHRHGISLSGFNAKDVDSYNGFKTRVREVISKTFCLLDVEIFSTNPRYLGDPIKI
jgi:SanA protein